VSLKDELTRKMSLLVPYRCTAFSDLRLETKYRVTTCLQDLQSSGILTAVREMSEILLKVRKVSGEKSCQGKVT